MLAKRVQAIQPSLTLQITSRAKELKSQGLDVVNFGAGEPDFDTPKYIQEAGINAIKTGKTRYTPASGLKELKEAVASYYLKQKGLKYSIDEININCGAKHSLYNIFMAICNPEDEVLIPSPYWVSYPEQVRLADAIPIVVQTSIENQYKVKPEDLEKKITSKTKAFILNSPSNPTGTVYSKEELKEIAKILKKYNIWCITDEIYDRLSYDEKAYSILEVFPELRNQTIIVNGVSKTFAMTGWRIGYTLGPTEIIKAINKIQSHSTSNPCTISQYAALVALNNEDDTIEKMIEEFKKRRNYIYAALKEIQGIEVFKPQGAFYIFPDIKNYLNKKFKGHLITTAIDFAKIFLEEEKVAVVPGEGFGKSGNLRFSYATSMEQIEKGIQRFKTFLNKLE